MIIEFPTALYIPILPSSPEIAGNVTYTISSEDPPRQSQILQQLPAAEILKPLPSKVFTPEENRAVLGDFIFSVSRSSRSETGSNKKQFEVGQFLDFGDQDTFGDLTVTEVPQKIDLQQNTNLLDLESLGLSTRESDTVTTQASAKFDEILEELNVIKTKIDDNKISISENQKSLNETEKTISAVELLDDVEDILADLRNTAEELISEREDLISNTNILNEQAKQKYNDLLKIRELVR